jgi:hypothetical protein
MCRFESCKGHMPAKVPKRGYRYYFQKRMIEVDYETGCWIWLGSQRDDGYGQIGTPIGEPGHRRTGTVQAQRHFYELYRGPQPHLDIGHNCHRRLCVKLKHLVALPHSENMQLMFQDYNFGVEDKRTCLQLMQDGFDISYIADKLMAPRPAVMKLIKRTNWHQLEFGV